jgi:nucleotide-binding universal stress UspA family protein
MIQIKTILVPIDFSAPSIGATRYGMTLARQFKAKLVVAHIVPESSVLAYAFPAETFLVEHNQRERAMEELKTLVAPDEVPPIDAKTIVRLGKIGEELLTIVKDEPIDLVVMGTHGRRNLGRWFLGSVTEQILRQVPVPVVTVSRSSEVDNAVKSGMMSLKRILFAADLPERSPGLSYAFELAQRSAAELTIVHVVEYLNLIYTAAAYINEERTQRIEEMRRRFDEFVSREKPSGLRVTTVILDGKPYDEILKVAESHSMDMIVLHMQGKGILERAFLGSTAERVVRLARIPVLSVPVKITS